MMPETKEMILLSEAFEIVEQQLAGKTLPNKIIPIQQALGRIIVEDQVSALDIPPFDKSAMDGYAVLEGDERQEYYVLETVPAGGVPRKRLVPGACTKVMTGAPVPEGAGKVIMVEQTRDAEEKIWVLSHAEVSNICRKGEDARCGDIVLRAPVVLGPLEIANLVCIGNTHVKVACRVRVSIISTGDELVDSPRQLAEGKILNSNGPLLSALCQKYGLEVVGNSVVPDELDATVSVLREALNNSDIVLLSGGVSVGDFDFATEAMKKVGLKLHFNRLAVKPGKPMTFASLRKKAVFGLPGNPVSVYLMFHLFVLYAAGLMTGQKHEVHYLKLPLGQDYHRRNAERLAYLPSRLTSNGTLEPSEYHGSAHLLALLNSDGFFIVPKGVTKLSAGEKVDFVSFEGGCR